MGQGWAIGLPILVAVVLWDTASKLTRQGPYFRAGLLWSVIGWIVGPFILFVGLMNFVNNNARQDAVWFIAIGSISSLAAVAGPWLGRTYVTWLVRRILRVNGSSTEFASASAKPGS